MDVIAINMILRRSVIAEMRSEACIHVQNTCLMSTANAVTNNVKAEPNAGRRCK